jgi:hypothetical protein
MSAIQQELLEKISHLDEAQQRRVLEFVDQIASPHHYTPSELLSLPPEERDRIMREAFDRAADEEFEIFEAYSEEDMDDYSS